MAQGQQKELTNLKFINRHANLISMKITENKLYSPGDRIKIISISGNYLGDLVHSYLRKFNNRLATVIEYRTKRARKVKIQVDGYKGFIWVKEDEINGTSN